MHTSGDSHKAEHCVALQHDTVSLWSRTGYRGPARLPGLRNWVGLGTKSPAANSPEAAPVRRQIFPSKASNPEQEHLPCLGQRTGEEQGETGEGTGSCSLPPGVPASSTPAPSALSPKYKSKSHTHCVNTNNRLLVWSWCLPTSKMGRDSKATKQRSQQWEDAETGRRCSRDRDAVL